MWQLRCPPRHRERAGNLADSGALGKVQELRLQRVCLLALKFCRIYPQTLHKSTTCPPDPTALRNSAQERRAPLVSRVLLPSVEAPQCGGPAESHCSGFPSTSDKRRGFPEAQGQCQTATGRGCPRREGSQAFGKHLPHFVRDAV